jgi:class 3 adenylate cyclase
MAVCPLCAHQNRPAARFCESCGGALAPDGSSLTEERKIVTALFCDLVGFTATSDGADPEDVDRMLSAYFSMARAQIEGHGGVVEKFIGDAVLGVFGVPVAHEDDPERAVRADAATQWLRFGIVAEQAFALLAVARCQARLGHASEAHTAATTARTMFARLGARPHLAETDRLMAGLARGS